MAVNKIQLHVVGYQNTNRMSHAYGKWYLRVNNDKTLNTRGFMRHICAHGITVPENIMAAVLTQFTECLTELLTQGVPVKLDGLGTFMPQFTSSGVTDVDKIDDGATIRSSIKGLHIRLLPDGTFWDNTQSTKNLANASIYFEGFVVDGSINKGIAGIDFTTEEPEP